MDSTKDDMWVNTNNYQIAIQLFVFCYEHGYLDDPKEQIYDSEAIIPGTPQKGKSQIKKI
jgi:hypothetical protein